MAPIIISGCNKVVGKWPQDKFKLPIMLILELFEVRGKLAQSRSNGEYVPLKLYRSHCQNSLSVSDVQGGMWCERQIEYRYLHPHMRRTKQWLVEEKKGKEIKKKTGVMLKGASIHEKKGVTDAC